MQGFVPGYPTPRAQWVEKSDSCADCGKRFTFFTSKGNCPHCGKLYCADCLQAECTITPGGSPVRVCLPCFTMIQQHRRQGNAVTEDARLAVNSPVDTAPSTSVSASASEPTTAALVQQFTDLMEKSEQLRGENTNMLKALALKEEVIASVTEALKHEQQQSETLRGEARVLKTAASEAQQKADALSATLMERDQAHEELVRQSAGRLADVEREGRVAEDERSRLAQQVSSLEEKNVQCSADAASTEAALTERISVLERERELRDQEQSATAQRAVDESWSQQEALKAAQLEIESVKSSLASKEKMVSEQNSLIFTLQQDVAAATARLREQEARESSTQESLGDELESQERRMQEHVQLQATLARLTSEQETLAKELESSQFSIAEERKRLSEAVASRDAQLQEQAGELSDVKQALNRSETLCRSLQSELSIQESKLKTTVEESKKEADARSLEVERLRGENVELTQTAHALQEKLDTGSAQLGILSTEKENLKRDISDLRALQKRSEESALHPEKSEDVAGKLAQEYSVKLAALKEEFMSEKAKLLDKLSAYEEKLVHTAKDAPGAQEQRKGEATDAASSDTPPPRDSSSVWRRPSVVSPIRYAVPPASELSSDVELHQSEKTFTWEYDVIAAAEKSPSILQSVASAVAQKLQLFTNPVDFQRWRMMSAVVELNYRNNPYHSAVHAADVMLSACIMLLSATEVHQHMTRLEKIAFTFAAMVHDVRHPGLSAKFLQKQFDPVYLEYNGRSPLEQMHVSTAFSLLSITEADFTAGMSPGDCTRLHRLVVQLVSHTDMGVHHELVSSWQQRAAAKSYNFANEDDRADVLALLLHACDLGASTKGVQVAQKWLTVLDEMYVEGDAERERGLQQTPAFARPSEAKSEEVARGQLAFLRSAVVPVYSIVEYMFPSLAQPMQHLRELYAHYQRKCGDASAFPPCAVLAAPALTDAPENTLRAAEQTATAQTDRARVDRDARALRAALEKVKSSSAKLAAREAALLKREQALQAVEERISADLRGASVSRGRDGAGEATASDAAVRDADDVEEKLLRAVAKVVEKERQLRQRAGEVERQRQELEEREKLTATLSDQLATIAQRVNSRRLRLLRREEQPSDRHGGALVKKMSPSKSSRPTTSTIGSHPRLRSEDRSDTPHSRRSKSSAAAQPDNVSQRLEEAVRHINAAISLANY